MIFYALYLFLLTLVVIRSGRNWRNQILLLSGRASWLSGGVSLFMLYLSADQAQLLFEVVQQHGIWGMWQFWSVMFGVFIIPLVFAPMWNRLQLFSDNDFTDLRYSGKGAEILKTFRAYYVGLIVVILLLSFHVMAFARVLTAFYPINKETALIITGFLLLVFSLKNVFSIKIKTDLLHAFFYLIAISVLAFYIINISGGLQNAISTLQEKNPQTLKLIPDNHIEFFCSIIFLSVQWWSVQCFDGGGPEMLRFRASKTEKSAVFTALLGVLLTALSGFVILILVVLLISAKGENVSEFNAAIIQIVPPWIQPVIVIGWFGLFISTCESLLTWSLGLWSKDFYNRIQGKQDTEPGPIFLLGSMFVMSLFAICIAYYSETLQSIIRWVFALSAGVAPVFLLRWFWMRINAWTQLSAMLSVIFTNAVYDIFKLKNLFSNTTNDLLDYVWKLIVLTLTTLVISFTVMMMTRKDSPEKIATFRERLPNLKSAWRNLFIATGFGILYFVGWNLLVSWLFR